MSKRDLKLIAATVTVCGVLFSVVGKIFGPDRILWEDAPWYGDISENLGWALMLIAPIIYIALDWTALFPKKDKKFEPKESIGNETDH